MIDIILPILYFLILFGFFEVGMFKKRRAYWHRPYATALYFGVATLGALFLFSMEPLRLALNSGALPVIFLCLLYVPLLYLAYRGHFQYGDSSSELTTMRRESFRYVGAKSIDILFQDTLAIIIFLALLQYTVDPLSAAVMFAVYFFVSHSLLFFILPSRFAAIFAMASVGASVAFAWVLFSGVSVLYIYVLHWAFYAASYSYIRKVRAAYIG
jgi:hypothetical protein